MRSPCYSLSRSRVFVQVDRGVKANSLQLGELGVTQGASRGTSAEPQRLILVAYSTLKAESVNLRFFKDVFSEMLTFGIMEVS